MKFVIPQMTIMLILWMIMYMIKYKKMSTNHSMSPFECGYNSLTSKMPMSIQFTLLVFVFLIFDIELSILISSNHKSLNTNLSWMWTMSTFLVCLMISVLYEMTKKSLKWM